MTFGQPLHSSGGGDAVAAQLWVVDDSPLQLLQTRQVLAKRYRVAEFSTGEEMLERFAHGPRPDLIVLDWQLPGVSGLEVCHFVREQLDESALPILMLTARDARGDFAAGLAAGANDYLAKPFDAAELLARVRTLLRIGEQARQLREREDELRMVTDAIPMLISFVTADERYRLVNKAYQNWFGRPHEAVLGRKVQEVIGEAAHAKVRPYIKRVLAGERFDVEEHAVPYRTGGTRDVKLSFIPHRDAAGVLDGYVALVEDITLRRLLEEESRSASTRVVEVLESIGDGFFAVDSEWRIKLVNRNYERLYGKRKEDMVGRLFWEVHPEAARRGSDFFQAYRRCMDRREEVQLLDYLPGRELWTDIRAFPTADGGIAVFFRDVSAERQVEEARKRQADFEKQLIGIVSHDLRNPLNAVLFSTGALARNHALGEAAAKTVARIDSAARRATRMVADLLDFTQARLGGGIHVQPRTTDLHAVVRAVLDEVEAAHPGRSVNVRSEGETSGEWDPDRLAQVVQNLATNALKYSPKDTAVDIDLRAAGEWICFSIHNWGKPISQALLANIFEPLHRGAGPLDQTERSIGLGLYIVKQVVEAHGGEVEVRSTEADGTRFTVRLPR